MKTIFCVLALLGAAACVLLSQGRLFTGEIMDSPCANMHSHSRMMQGLNAKDAKECTQRCVKELKGKYALWDSSSNTAYQIDNQDKAAAFAGQKVKITGSLDTASKTIHLETIEPQ